MKLRGSPSCESTTAAVGRATVTRRVHTHLMLPRLSHPLPAHRRLQAPGLGLPPLPPPPGAELPPPSHSLPPPAQQLPPHHAPPPPPRPPIDAPCTQCFRHGDPMHAQERLTAAAISSRSVATSACFATTSACSCSSRASAAVLNATERKGAVCVSREQLAPACVSDFLCGG
jgi:hypothetical protein